jgi:Uma2 family endonuclease
VKPYAQHHDALSVPGFASVWDITVPVVPNQCVCYIEKMPASEAHSALPLRLLTDEQWSRMDEDEAGELVDGVLEEEEVPDWVHEVAVAWLVRVLGAWVTVRGGFAAGSEAKYLLRRGRGRKSDVSIFLPGNKPPPRRGAVRRPPDIMIEVVAPVPRDVRRDRIDKMIDYASFGVRYYWIADPEARTFEIHELGVDQRYTWVIGTSTGKLAAVPGCPGLELDLDTLWLEIDRLGPEEPEEEAE